MFPSFLCTDVANISFGESFDVTEVFSLLEQRFWISFPSHAEPTFVETWTDVTASSWQSKRNLLELFSPLSRSNASTADAQCGCGRRFVHSIVHVYTGTFSLTFMLTEQILKSSILLVSLPEQVEIGIYVFVNIWIKMFLALYQAWIKIIF